ncbi:ATP-binding cassette domain-containing protein [Infirmifilum sp. NZ]|uniref:ATP-binding cassette domain-containing protein n=1 Tax=Infirmifilum sp. NZ TaxID=2926850 RepID=UPI0027A55B76|nr:ATP-binding cassette domain-containing protein [Infirmifilum sp. NZ]UNQ73507.1 ATP-binding cassette domain-containing protein [Infirmifilum sp. NZ]
MIRLEGVEVAFDGRRVLWVPSAVFRGSSVILGPNGAGKTTLLKAIVGLYRPARVVGDPAVPLRPADEESAGSQHIRRSLGLKSTRPPFLAQVGNV